MKSIQCCKLVTSDHESPLDEQRRRLDAWWRFPVPVGQSPYSAPYASIVSNNIGEEECYEEIIPGDLPLRPDPRALHGPGMGSPGNINAGKMRFREGSCRQATYDKIMDLIIAKQK